MRCLTGLDRLLDRIQYPRRKQPPHPPAVFEKMFADAPYAHHQLQIYQLPDAPPPPKLPPPPESLLELLEPLELSELQPPLLLLEVRVQPLLPRVYVVELW